MEVIWNPTCPTMGNICWPPGFSGKNIQLGVLSGKQGDHVIIISILQDIV